MDKSKKPDRSEPRRRSLDGHRAQSHPNGRHKNDRGAQQSRASRTGNHRGDKSRTTSDKQKKKEEKVIVSSPRLVFLRRRVKQVYKDIETDRKATCGRLTCKNIRIFVGLLAVLFFLRGAFRQYFTHVLEHLHTHFTLSMKELEFLIGVEKVGFVLIIIFAGYYGNKMHKPLAILVGSIFCACGILLCAVPYFLEISRGIKNLTDPALYYEAGLCQIGTNVTKTSMTQCETLILHPNSTQAFSILATGNFIVGIGSALLLPLGFLYIEEASEKNIAPLFYGIILCLNGVGETIGLVFAWQFTNLPFTLSETLTLEEWRIGAWWLGLPILAGLFIFVSLPLLLFPKWIVEPKWLVKRRDRQLKHWLMLVKEEEKFVEKIKRRQRRKKKKVPTATLH